MIILTRYRHTVSSMLKSKLVFFKMPLKSVFISLYLFYSAFSDAGVVQSYYDETKRLIVYFDSQSESIKDVRKHIARFYERELQKLQNRKTLHTVLTISTTNCEVVAKRSWNWLRGPDRKLMKQCYKEWKMIKSEIKSILKYLTFLQNLMCQNPLELECVNVDDYQRRIQDVKNQISHLRQEIQTENDFQISISRRKEFMDGLSMPHQNIQIGLKNLKKYIEEHPTSTENDIKEYIRSQMKSETSSLFNSILALVENLLVRKANKKIHILRVIDSLIVENSQDFLPLYDLDPIFKNSQKLLSFISIYSIPMNSVFIDEWLGRVRERLDSYTNDNVPTFVSLIDELEHIHQSNKDLLLKTSKLFLFKYKSPYFQQCRQWLRKNSITISRTKSFIPYHLSVFLNYCYNAGNRSAVNDFMKYEKNIQAHLNKLKEYILGLQGWVQNLHHWLESDESKNVQALVELIHPLESHLQLKTIATSFQKSDLSENLEKDEWGDVLINFFKDAGNALTNYIFNKVFEDEIEKFSTDDSRLLNNKVTYFNVPHFDDLNSSMFTQMYPAVLINIDQLVQLYSKLKNNIVMHFDKTATGKMYHFLENSRKKSQKKVFSLNNKISHLEQFITYYQDQIRMIRRVSELAGKEWGLKNPSEFYHLPLLHICYQFKILGEGDIKTIYTEVVCSDS